MTGVNNPEFQRTPGEFRIETVGAAADPVTTLGGVTITPDITLDDVDPAASAMLVLPGAQTWDSGNDEFIDAARRFLDAGTPVAAICGATVGLARGGLLDDRAHTSNAPQQLAATGYCGADRYLDVAAVTDREVITAGAVAPIELAREVFARLGVYDDAVLDAWYRLCAHHDPAGFLALGQQ